MPVFMLVTSMPRLSSMAFTSAMPVTSRQKCLYWLPCTSSCTLTAPLLDRQSLVEDLDKGRVAAVEVVAHQLAVVGVERELDGKAEAAAVKGNHGVELIGEETRERVGESWVRVSWNDGQANCMVSRYPLPVSPTTISASRLATAVTPFASRSSGACVDATPSTADAGAAPGLDAGRRVFDDQAAIGRHASRRAEQVGAPAPACSASRRRP